MVARCVALLGGEVLGEAGDLLELGERGQLGASVRYPVEGLDLPEAYAEEVTFQDPAAIVDATPAVVIAVRPSQ